MGLIDLKTNLKDLKFGKDRIKGGNSNQPYIQTSIPEETEGAGNFANHDFILRGGLNTAKDAITDVKRLSKWFFDLKNPSGLLFIAKQNLLSRTAVRTQSNTGLLNEGVYTPISTLIQAGGNAFGLHVNKQGLNPFSGIGESYTPKRYFDTVKDTNTNIIEPTSRTTSPFRQFNVVPIESMTTTSNEFFGEIEESESSITFTTSNKRNRLISLWNDSVAEINNDSINVLTYSGGPGSFLGIGKTNIRYATNNFGAPSRTTDAITGYTLDYNDLKEIAGEGEGNIGDFRSPVVVDFRKKLNQELNSLIFSNAPNYSGPDAKNIEKRVNLGDPGNKAGKNLVSYTNGAFKGAASINSYDKITALPIYKSDSVLDSNITNDLIKFRIGVIDNNTPNIKTYIHFRAFLDQISDSYNSNWESSKYIGRGENFYTYSGFDRKVSLSWTVAAQSKAELIPMYKKLNYLASVCTPDYSNNGYMRGNIVTLTVGGYFYEQPGIITSLNYEMNGENETWEIGINDEGNDDSSVKELPHLIRVTGFNFIPIHEFVPRLQQNVYADDPNNMYQLNTLDDFNGYGLERYIALTSITSNYNRTPPIAEMTPLGIQPIPIDFTPAEPIPRTP